MKKNNRKGLGNQMNEQFINLIKNAQYLVALTGAGLSTDSGLSDYRGPNGVWTRKNKGLEPLPSPKIDQVEPNTSHYALVTLFEMGILKFIISQNVDNLHLKSGISYNSLVELHGNHNLLKCVNCDRRYTLKEVGWDKNIYGKGYRREKIHPQQPKCPFCQGRLISTIINFGDPMPDKELQLATYHAKRSDVFLVLGSSLAVQPAASLPMESYNKGGKILIVNEGKTSLDQLASIKLEEKTSKILDELIRDLRKENF